MATFKRCREKGSAKGQVVNQEMQATKVVNHETQERKLSEGAGGQKMAHWFLLLVALFSKPKIFSKEIYFSTTEYVIHVEEYLISSKHS